MTWRWMDLVDAILSPLGFGLLLALVLWGFRARLPRTLFRIGIFVEILCLVASTPLGANMLVTLEERRAPPPATCAAPLPGAIVVLSGGVRRESQDPHDIGVLNAASLQRVLAGAELARRTPGATLVISGGAREADSAAQSSVMAEIARRLGVPAEAIRVETASQTTWENAKDVRALSPPLPERIWLVTSALHMPRALIAFRAAGFDPCSYPSDYLSAPFEGVGDLLPAGTAVANAAAALHEMVGEIVYRLRAR